MQCRGSRPGTGMHLALLHFQRLKIVEFRVVLKSGPECKKISHKVCKTWTVKRSLTKEMLTAREWTKRATVQWCPSKSFKSAEHPN